MNSQNWGLITSIKNAKKIGILFAAAIIMIGGFFVSASPAQAMTSSTIYYVDANIEASGDGTAPESAFKTVQEAIAIASDGDTINISAGEYVENLTINKALTLSGPNATINPNSTTETRETEGVIAGVVTISADGVIIKGLTITNPAGKQAIYASDKSNIVIVNNIITDVGTADVTTSGTNFGIGIVSSAATVDSITISNNKISGIAGGNKKSADGIAIGWSTGANNITNLVIESNEISNVTSDTSDYALGGRGAYGILINHASPAAGGQTQDAQIKNNIISNLEGFWAHAIGLEGNTPNALVSGNIISNIIDYKTPTDAVAVQFEDNPSADTVTVENNIFGPNVNVGVQNVVAGVTAKDENKNWGAEYPDFGTIVSANVDYDPWYFDGDMTQSSAQIATEFQGIASTLSSNGIASNISDVTASSIKDFSGLYFEKSMSGVKMGKITFTSSLDLSSQATTDFLKALGDKMDANQPGVIGLNFAGLTEDPSLKGVAAEIVFYGLNNLGFTAESTAIEILDKMVARDDSENILDKSGLITPETASYADYTFTVGVAHFTKYEIDTTPPAKATFSADKTAATNTDVAVTITYPADAVVKQYAINDGAFEDYTGPVTMVANGAVLAQSADLVGNVSEVAQYDVNNIDKSSAAPSDLTVGSDG